MDLFGKYDDWDNEDKEQYDKRYVEAIKNHGADAEYEAVLDELRGIKYNPSNSPENDARMNYLEAKSKLRKKRDKEPHVEAYKRFMRTRDGLSRSEIDIKVRKYLKEED